MRVDLECGKYTYIFEDGRARLLRYDKPTCRDVVGDKLIYCMAVEIDELRQQLAATKNDAADLIRILVKQQQENAQLRQQVKLLSDFATKISEQLPEKPDHWSSCSQCEYNSSEAQDIIEALAATEPKP